SAIPFKFFAQIHFMFFHFQIFLYSLFFFFILEVIAGDVISSRLADVSGTGGGIWLAILAFLLLFVYFYQITKRVSQRISMTPIPLLLVVSTLGLLYFVQSIKQEQLLILLSAFAYYFLHIALYRLRSYEKDQTARGIIAAGSVATIFLFNATAYGIYLNFAISLWILMTMLMAITVLVSFQYFWLINDNKKNVLNYSLVLGFVMAEIVWVLNFWPFGYLTTGVISLIFYYVFWDLVQCHFLNTLSKKRVITNMFFFGVLMALVLSSTRWLPVL
ncbi:MAG TPA: hypothetical protein DIT56_03110, partial [Candidatus Moranbacteria bacterium]|nr:hypothetical protein [Candidatus Moranbacteria bacterium]